MSKPVRLLLVAFAAICLWWTPFALKVLYFQSFPATPHPQDFNYYYDAARVGLTWGWSHIYDLDLQRQVFEQVRGSNTRFDWATEFVSLPPMAWLVAPLAPLPYSAAYWTWVALSFVAYCAVGWWVVPGDRLTRATVLLAGIWIHPLLGNFQMGQNSLLVALATASAYMLLIKGRPVAAGALLAAAIVLKPQVAALVPLTLLAWGARRLFVSWCVGSAALGGASLLSLGTTGLAQLRADLALEQAQTSNAVWTPAMLVGLNNWALAIEVLAVVVALATAYMSRRRGPEIAVVAGLLATLLAAGYHHEHDYVALLIAAWIWLRTAPRGLRLAWLVPGFLAMALVAPRGPRPVLLFAIGSLLLLALEVGIEEHRHRGAHADGGLEAAARSSPAAAGAVH